MPRPCTASLARPRRRPDWQPKGAPPGRGKPGPYADGGSPYAYPGGQVWVRPIFISPCHPAHSGLDRFYREFAVFGFDVYSIALAQRSVKDGARDPILDLFLDDAL
ncbi:MAG: hypothetical protein ABI324_26230, partial [Ktedonobacteraceae bacterium]